LQVANFVGSEGSLFVASGGVEGEVGFDVEFANALFLEGDFDESEVGIEDIVAADWGILRDGADVALFSGGIFFDVKAYQMDRRAG